LKHKGRNKYQLIALFRYWAMKGIDQFTLSKMKKNTTRRDICRYLNQIRLIIYNDFVPHFLGACSRGRDFFLQQNTKTAKETAGGVYWDLFWPPSFVGFTSSASLEVR
jgi:hypothetical protein